MEPRLDRDLELAARRFLDLYAMALPYRVSIVVGAASDPDRGERTTRGSSSAAVRSRCANPFRVFGLRRVRSAGHRSVRDGLGRAGRFGRPAGNSCPVFGLLAPIGALRRTENPRVDGSIPSLATIFNLMI